MVLILSCAGSLLPWLEGVAMRETTPSVPLQGVHNSCNLLLAMAVMSSCSLTQLHQTLIGLLLDGAEERKRPQFHMWHVAVEDYLAPPTGGKPHPFCLTLKPHPSHWGILLQASHELLIHACTPALLAPSIIAFT